MKRIIFVLISVIIFFTACSNNPPKTQIDPADEFGGVMFGMNQEEVVKTLGKQPWFTFKDEDIENSGGLDYYPERYFNVDNADVNYLFSSNKLFMIVINYVYDNYDEYPSGSAQKQKSIDYDIIKKELLDRYPKEIWTYSDEMEAGFTFRTENRSVSLMTASSTIQIYIYETYSSET